MCVAQFRKFTDSRFLTVASSMRSLCGALALGLEQWLRLVYEDEAQSQYYIRGSKRLTEAINKYSVVASFAAWPADAAMVALMEDDRLVATVDSIEADLMVELQWLADISPGSRAVAAAVEGRACLRSCYAHM